MMRQLIAIFFLLMAITGYYAVPLDEVRAEVKNNSSNSSTDSVSVAKPVILPETSTSTSTTVAPSTTETLVEVKILETSNSSSTSIKSEPTRTTKQPTRTRTTRTTKAPRTRKTTVRPASDTVYNATAVKQPLTRQDWLKLIQSEMETYDKKAGNSPISNKNLTIISERILKYLVENGTQIGISLREQKDGTIKYVKGNVTVGDKIYGEGTESKFPPVIEYIVQRIQAYFSVYAHEDHSRPATTEKATDANEIQATLREDIEDNDSESSTLSNDEVMEQLEDELSEIISSDAVRNVTQIKLPSLIKSAYDRIQSWFLPGKPSAKEEPVQESEEESSEATDAATGEKPTKKPSIIKGAYDALEAILSVFDEIDVSDEEEKVEAPEKPDAELKESQDDLEETEIKETVGENLYDFLKLAYTLYDESES